MPLRSGVMAINDDIKQDIVRLMELASESMSLLALPQTDSSEETAQMPKNRSAAFATNAEEYFRTLNVSF